MKYLDGIRKLAGLQIPIFDNKRLSPDAVNILSTLCEGPWDELDWTEALMRDEERTGVRHDDRAFDDPYSFKLNRKNNARRS